MAIRIRKVKGNIIALCAAKTGPQKGDLYLNDIIHHALSEKFYNDFNDMGFIKKQQGKTDERKRC